MFCTRCGTENKNGDTTCIACGAPLASTRIQENLFGGYSSSINEKLGKLHGISRKFYLNEAEETKKRIRNKLIVSVVIAIPLLLSCFEALVSYLPEVTIPELQTTTSIELYAAAKSLMTPLVLGLVPLGISTATEYLRDHQEYKNIAIALTVFSFFGLAIVTIPALAISGIPGFFYLKNKRQKAIEEIKQYGLN